MDCPKCKVALAARQAEGQPIEVDDCPECEGIWFDKKELEKLMPLARKKLELHWKAEHKEYLCPRCRVGLYEFVYPQTEVHIDMCQKCRGVWLDGGEFEAIQEARQKRREIGRLADDDPHESLTGSVKHFMAEFVEHVVKVKRMDR